MRLIALNAVGAFACKGTAFRDAAIEAGAVDKLVQVQYTRCRQCCTKLPLPLSPRLRRCALRVLWPWQFLARDDLSVEAAEHGAWAAYVLAEAEPRPPVAAVRQLQLCVCVPAMSSSRCHAGSRAMCPTQVKPLVPALNALFDTCAAVTKAVVCRALSEITAERAGVQVR